jgi:glycosyltransferase involved in cell wall biosynthesis
VLCTVGRISPEKGQTFAIEVANELKRFGARFRWYFVGDGSDREKCEILVSKYGLNDYCSFTGMLLNPYSYIEACDIYVQTSYVEAESITIRESKILGKAIITTNLPVFEEALSDYARGCTYPFDSREIAHAIIAESKSKHLQNEVIDVSQTVNNRIFQQLRKILNC